MRLTYKPDDVALKPGHVRCVVDYIGDRGGKCYDSPHLDDDGVPLADEKGRPIGHRFIVDRVKIATNCRARLICPPADLGRWYELATVKTIMYEGSSVASGTGSDPDHSYFRSKAEAIAEGERDREADRQAEIQKRRKGREELRLRPTLAN